MRGEGAPPDCALPRGKFELETSSMSTAAVGVGVDQAKPPSLLQHPPRRPARRL